jgi:hypothetical protein
MGMKPRTPARCDDRDNYMNHGMTCLQALPAQQSNWCDACYRRALAMAAKRNRARDLADKEQA